VAAALAALALALGGAAPAAADDDDEDDDTVVVDDDDSAGDDDGERARPTRKKAAAPRAPDGDGGDGGGDGDQPFKKQDLTGHDVEGGKKENAFERDRFFVDKSDTDKTEKGTLIQGSVTSTTFGYREAGGTLTPPVADGSPVPSASQFSRMFTELRLQTDFRHIAASRFSARVDVRGRAVNDPAAVTPLYEPGTNSSVQSGFLGENELEVKELWLIRSGVRSDVTFGRQFIPDLGAVKIDGLRIDYASSSKFTFVGFGGLYPIRGSRSISTDYTEMRSSPANDGTRSPAGKYTGAGGFGAAYRTANAYGAFGGVAVVPLSSESPRISGTSSGYWRSGTQLDFYHLAVVDVVSSSGAGLTNLSLGLNYKPDQRLRGSLAFHRVDTETLGVQAQAFLSDPDPEINVIQNEAYISRIATNQARASLSAGLGSLQRFEVTAAFTVRQRGEVVLTAPPQVSGATPATATLPSSRSAEVYGSITDRHSVARLRLGVDGSRVFSVGNAALYQRTQSLALRAFAARELASGHGEWEAEVAYSSNKDDSGGMICADIISCFGSSESTILSLGGNLYYRINRDWLMLGSVFLNRASIAHVDMLASTEDPPVTGLSGYFRLAYRF
jgi:hypothetical protein